jgi:hypothetical protein
MLDVLAAGLNAHVPISCDPAFYAFSICVDSILPRPRRQFASSSRRPPNLLGRDPPASLGLHSSLAQPAGVESCVNPCRGARARAEETLVRRLRRPPLKTSTVKKGGVHLRRREDNMHHWETNASERIGQEEEPTCTHTWETRKR